MQVLQNVVRSILILNVSMVIDIHCYNSFVYCYVYCLACCLACFLDNYSPISVVVCHTTYLAFDSPVYENEIKTAGEDVVCEGI